MPVVQEKLHIPHWKKYLQLNIIQESLKEYMAKQISSIKCYLFMWLCVYVIDMFIDYEASWM